MVSLNKPVIMTAIMGKQDLAWADALRREYYPAERNQLPAHITLFHHLPPQALSEIISAVKIMTKEEPAPSASLQRLIHLGKGVAYQLYSPELLTIRMALSDMFHGLLVAQDQQTPRLHITIQNKVTSREAKALMEKLFAIFEPRPFEIKGLALHYYLDGPWQLIGEWPFRGYR